MPLLCPELIYTPDGFLSGYTLEVDPEGRIMRLFPSDNPPDLDGILCPGFVNAHCHLELSALKGMIPELTGMAGFVRQLMTIRDSIPEAESVTAIRAAIQEIRDTGTVAVGDISNSTLSIGLKSSAKDIFFHTFVEVFGQEDERGRERIKNAFRLIEKLQPAQVSLTLHAPYSMTPDFRHRQYLLAKDMGNLLSIHLLESKEERAFFETQSGPLWDFIQAAGMQAENWAAKGILPHLLAGLDEETRLILVHNTEMRPEELETIRSRLPHAMFCLCPRANRYIHGTQPDAAMFSRFPERICIGTDSLAGNYSLDLWEEVRSLNRAAPRIPLHTLLKWATTNGAKALGQYGNFGIFEAGLKPGVNLIEKVDLRTGSLTAGTRVRKLF
jgi:cytosine/adenosine deaminase-related metal-dependent hydrolase